MMSRHTSLNTTSKIAAPRAQHTAATPCSSASPCENTSATPCETTPTPSCTPAHRSASKHDTHTPHATFASCAPHEQHEKPAHKTLQQLNRKRAGYRAETEDDDGYDPYSDRTTSQPLFERDPWN